MTFARTNGAPQGQAAISQAHLGRIDLAVARGDSSGASRACEDAYHAARHDRSWEGLIDVGAACLRVGEAGPRWPAIPLARRAYFAAFFLAYQQESLDGVVRAARAFAALGDRQSVDECLGLADLMVFDDGEARGRLHALVADLGVPYARSALTSEDVATSATT